MNTVKLISVLLAATAVAAVAACTAGEDSTGTSEHAATADVDHLFKRPDGNYDVWCSDGKFYPNVKATEIVANTVCPQLVECVASTAAPAHAWKAPAAATVTACTPADIALIGGSGTTAQKLTALQTQNPTCFACAVTPSTADAWGPWTLTGNTPALNPAACFANAVGGSAACGAAYDRFAKCVTDACSTCPNSISSTACQQKAAGGICKPFDYSAACGGAAAAGVASQCNTTSAQVIASCGGATPPAAGGGSGTPDAGASNEPVPAEQ